jgi:hypothetical protein
MQKVFSADIYSQEFHGTREVSNGIVFTVAFMGTALAAKTLDNSHPILPGQESSH